MPAREVVLFRDVELNVVGGLSPVATRDLKNPVDLGYVNSDIEVVVTGKVDYSPWLSGEASVFINLVGYSDGKPYDLGEHKVLIDTGGMDKFWAGVKRFTKRIKIRLPKLGDKVVVVPSMTGYLPITNIPFPRYTRVFLSASPTDVVKLKVDSVVLKYLGYEAPSPPPPTVPVNAPKGVIESITAPREVEAGKEFTLKVRVKNEGAPGILVVRVERDGVREAARSMTFNSGEVRNVGFLVRAPEKEGKYVYRVVVYH